MRTHTNPYNAAYETIIGLFYDGKSFTNNVQKI